MAAHQLRIGGMGEWSESVADSGLFLDLGQSDSVVWQSGRIFGQLVDLSPELCQIFEAPVN